MAEFCVSCGSKVNCGDKFCFKCGAKVLSGRESTSEQENASSSAKPMSQFLASKAEKRSGFFKPSKCFKRKAPTGPGSSSRSKLVDNRVVINVGLIRENEEGKLAVVRGSKVALKVGKDFGAVEVLRAAVKKHADHDQFFCGDEDYILLYPDQKEVVKVPGSDEKFTVAKYKQELAKPYSKVDLYICREEDFKKDRDMDDEDDTKKKCKDKTNDLIDILSDDDSMFEHSVFDSPPELFPDDYQISPSTSRESSSRQHGPITQEGHLTANKNGKKAECPTCHVHFFHDEIAEHADFCAENAHTLSFLGQKDPPANDIPEESIASAEAETSNTARNAVPLTDILNPLVAELESQIRINVRRG